MKVMGLPQTRAVIIILVLSFQLASADQSVDVQERKEWLESKLAWAEMRIVELELALYACKANADLLSEDNRGANESAPRTLPRATSARLSVVTAVQHRRVLLKPLGTRQELQFSKSRITPTLPSRRHLLSEENHDGACKDNNACLQEKPGWGIAYTCESSTKYCNGHYASDMACCKKSCGKCTTPPTAFPTFAPSSALQFSSLTPTVIPTLPPSVLPSATPTRMPTRMPSRLPTRTPTFLSSAKYELRTSGRCALDITLAAECEQAAADLELDDETVSDDKKTKNRYDPPGCYFRNGFADESLMLNVDRTNTGTCVRSVPCLCKLSTVSPTGFPTFSPTMIQPLSSLMPTLDPTSALTLHPTQIPYHCAHVNSIPHNNTISCPRDNNSPHHNAICAYCCV